jgi:pimeloyl-ACP methyl ester carboxylesterase
MGAAAAVIAAAENPALVSGVVLVGPFVRDTPVPAWQRLMFRGMMAGPWARLAWLSYYPTFFPTRKGADYAEHRAAIGKALARKGYARAFRATTRTSHAPAEAVLDRLHTQVMVVMGSKDPDFPDQRAEAELIAQRLHGRAVMIPDAGHYPHAEFPELTSPPVVDFARSITGAHRGA